MATFTYWNNLMGDPAGEMWTDVPQAITVTHPDADRARRELGHGRA